jgi:hypothetical protein
VPLRAPHFRHRVTALWFPMPRLGGEGRGCRCALPTSAIESLLCGSPCPELGSEGRGCPLRSPPPPWTDRVVGPEIGRLRTSAPRAPSPFAPMVVSVQVTASRSSGLTPGSWFSIHRLWCARLMLARRRKFGRGACHACSGVRFHGLWNESHVLVACRCSPGLIERLFDLPTFERRGCPRSGRPEPTCARMDARACLRRRWGAQRAPSPFACQAGYQGPQV